MKAKLILLIRNIVDDPVRAGLGLHAAAGAYYLFLSLGPFIALLLALVPYLPIPKTRLPELLLAHTPEVFRQMVYLILSQLYAGSLAALGLSLAAELWSAGKFFSSLLQGLHDIFGGNRFPGFFRRRTAGALYTLALLLFITGGIVIRLFGEKLLSLARTYMPGLEPLLETLVPLGRLLFPALMTLGCALLYSSVPRRKFPFLLQLPGSLIATGGWLLFSRVYSSLVEQFRFFSIYGSLAIVFLSLFWMYCSLYIFFLGAWFNIRLEHICPFVKNKYNPVRK